VHRAFHDALEKGIALFNRQEFYEAHEAWEAGWIDEIAEERALLQGLIQVAAGFYKLQTGSPPGAVKLLDEGAKKLRRFVGRSEGVDIDALLPVVDRWQQEAVSMVAGGRADHDPKLFPRIGYVRQPES
jgi:uncharacterized protein